MTGGLADGDRLGALRRGLVDMLPGAPAMAAWALVTGVAMAQSALTLPQAVGLSVLAYAGSAQLAALPFLVAGAPIAVSVLAALTVNLRFVIYSAALSASLRGLPRGERLGLGYLISDLGYVLYSRHEQRWRGSPLRGWYFAGLGLGVFAVWHLASFVGLFAAAAIPHEWGLDFAGTLALLAVLVPMLARRPTLAGSAAAAALSVALDRLPFRLGLIGAIVGGIVVAVSVEPRREARR